MSGFIWTLWKFAASTALEIYARWHTSAGGRQTMTQFCLSRRQAKGAYEKLGEATETALSVLVEKLNFHSTDKSSLNKRELGSACNHAIQDMWHKEFTLEFSRDRKSMSVCCSPSRSSKAAGTTRMFAKVRLVACRHPESVFAGCVDVELVRFWPVWCSVTVLTSVACFSVTRRTDD